MDNQEKQQNITPEPAAARPPESSRRINPRWFLLADPDTFFNELLMEQTEQQ